ncbi:MAG: HAMP domain-containing sensor histidine kinase [Coleofasciculaceae cyanobacterium]
MLNTSQFIAAQTETIMERWMEVVRQDRQVESSVNLSDTALGDSLPKLLKSLAAVLDSPQDQHFQSIVQASLDHGDLRARQGYDAAEIVREYSLLRRLIFSVLEPRLLEGSPQEIIAVFGQIDAVLDEAISLCFKTYVQSRLNELEQLQSQLTLTNQELTRLFEASKDNLSYLAHELKTPLTSVIGYSELLLRLQDKNVTDATSLTIRSIEQVLKGGRHLLRIVNDSLELSRYQSAQMKLNLEVINVRSVINIVVEMLAPLAQLQGLQLKINSDHAPHQAFTDTFRLQQILTNLVGNAIRYTDEGSVVISCHSLPNERWSIAVTDTGIGIATEDCDRLFEPYSQAFFNQGSRKHEGTGLGLAIVSRLVKLLQGEIQFVSEVGVGSTFTVIFPINL